MIAESDGKLASYYERQMKGENIPEVTIQNEQRRKEDLENKRSRLQKEIEAETHLYPTDPKILSTIRAVSYTHLDVYKRQGLYEEFQPLAK